ncbi:MAG TPA: Ni/Fe hydrogenase subunit beta [Phycisphaerales bacterium]|nr:Ni/Fe hydrogenase subunit beta [Phycisphaerales bacterium]
MKKISQEAFAQFVTALIVSERQVVGVQAKDDRFAFGPLEQAADLRLDYDVTILPPKNYVLPPRETLLTYEVGGTYNSMIEAGPLVLLGVHPYDLVAINQMDELFSQDQYDAHYMARRKQITIVACDVAMPSKNVFASSMGTAVVDKGYDILITDVGEGYVLDVATDKGRELIALAGPLPDASDQDLARRQAVQDKNRKELNRHPLECKPSYLPKLLERAYDHPIWEQKAQTCFSCGSCNLVCPTCYCFDVQDDVDWDLKKGCRWRAWDGCLLENFATVAGDHNFRKRRADRFRHRLYRKAKYVPEKIGGQIACVGCGRCVGACIPDIANPVAVYNALLEDIGMD